MIEVALADLVPDPFGLRVYYDDEMIEKLAGSILQNGIVTPLLVRPKNGVYDIIDGNYRYKALQHISWKKPVSANTEEMTDEEALLRAVLANWHRKSFTFMDKARAVKKLKDSGFSNEEVTIKLEFKHPKTLYQYLEYEEKVLKETKEIVKSHPRMTRRHGQALIMLKDYTDKQRELAELIVTKPLSGPQAVSQAKNFLSPPKPKLKCEFRDYIMVLAKAVRESLPEGVSCMECPLKPLCEEYKKAIFELTHEIKQV